MLNDGRIVYTRWDYVDRNAAKFHGLWTCNPDGTNPGILFGNYTTRPWACYQAKAVPGSDRILFVAGGHHANVGGTLVMLDPSRVGLGSAERRGPFRGPRVPHARGLLSPRPKAGPRATSTAPGRCRRSTSWWPSATIRSAADTRGNIEKRETGLYYFDRFGNLELLFRRKGISAVYPIPLAPRTPPPVRIGDVAAGIGRGGRVSAFGRAARACCRCRPAAASRNCACFSFCRNRGPTTRTIRASAIRTQSNARMLLGTVPVEKDGSAYFRAPARKPLYFQAVDESGRAVQSMRTIVYLQPGERRSCVGCHEPPGTAPARRAGDRRSRAPPSAIQPGPDGSQPFCYPAARSAGARPALRALPRRLVGPRQEPAGADRRGTARPVQPSPTRA